MSFPTGFTKLAHFDIDYTKVSGSGDLTNYPLLLLDGNFSANVYSNCDNGGGDLRFSSDSAGSTQLACEVVTFNTGTSKAEVYVKIPTLSHTVNTTIYIWGKYPTQTQPAVSDTYGRNAVWVQYKCVLHGEAATDSAGLLTLTGYGTPTYSATNAKIGKGITLNGSSQYLMDSTAYIMALAAGSPLYYEAWVYNTSSAYANLFSLGYDGAQRAAMNNVFYQQVLNSLKPTSLIKNDAWIAATNAISSHTLTHVVGCFNGTNTISFLKDGVANGTPAETPTVGTCLDRGFFVGCYGGCENDSYTRQQFFNGVLDELRVSFTNLGVGWGTTSYNNQYAPSTFGICTDISSEEIVGPFPTFFRP
jgi:hypothetical protein